MKGTRARMYTTVVLVSSAITYLAGVCSHVETSDFECMDRSTFQYSVLKVAAEEKLQKIVRQNAPRSNSTELFR